MSFLDLLNQPLPSASDDYTTESAFGIDLPTDDDDEVMDLDTNIGAGDNAFGVITGEENPDLSPEEDAEADKLINLAATPVVLKEELSPEEVTEFAQGYEYGIACDEGFLLEECENEFLSSPSMFTEAKFYNKNMVRMTKEARTNQLFEICVQAIARAKNDPIYWKLHKVQIARRRLKGMLRQKYKAPAMKKAREYLIRLRASKSPVLSKAASKMQSR